MLSVKLFLKISLRPQVAVSVMLNDDMRRCVMFRSHCMIFLTLAFLSFPLANAQDSEEFDEPLSKKQAEKTVKSAEDALKDAKRAQSRGDTPRMDRALEGYSYHMDNLERGLHDGNVLHDEHKDVALIVAEATSKHMSTLEELRAKVPDQGKAGIDRAYAVSQQGHDTALENLSRNDEPLSKKQAKKTVKLAEDALKDAKRAQSRDDTPRMGRELERYSSHMNKLESGLHDGSVLHDEHEDVALIVAEATSKHMSTLEELRGKVPPQGKAGIDRAFEVSQRGHDTALENLSKDRRDEVTQRHERQHRPSSTGQSSGSDGSLRGSPPGAGPGTVGGPGRGGSPGGGGSQGGNRGRR